MGGVAGKLQSPPERLTRPRPPAVGSPRPEQIGHTRIPIGCSSAPTQHRVKIVCDQLSSMSISTPSSAFDSSLALSVVPSVLQLAELSTLASATPTTDPDARLAKVKVSKEASLSELPPLSSIRVS